jgi:UDP-N-acetylglucosamine:LPS N-acetylglucosamine transferase
MVIPRIVVFSASIGAGHDGAATELADRLRADGYDVTVHDFLDMLPARLGRLARAGYAEQLKIAPGTWGWVLGALQRHAALAQLAVGLSQLAATRRMRTAIGATPDAVVSTYPLASQVLGRLRRRGLLVAPVITFLTDMSVHRLWVAGGVDAHLALHDVAAEQARRWGAGGVRVCGPAVPPAFWPAGSAAEQRRARARFGLPATTPLALVVAGSWGVGDIAHAVRDIADCGLVTPVVACGHNETLRRRLTELETVIPIGWTDDMPALVRACDVVVQNAGGLSSLEALACGVPVVTYRCLPGHGLTNARALDEAGWAVWIRTPEQLPTILKRALAGEQPVPAISQDRNPAAAIATIACTWKAPS